GPILNDPNCQANVTPPNDDGSFGPVELGFTMDFFGQNETQGWVNNNGNFTFNGRMSTYTPFNLLSTRTPILAAFFADVDTRNPASNVVTYGRTTVNGHNALCVDWINVGYYAGH